VPIFAGVYSSVRVRGLRSDDAQLLEQEKRVSPECCGFHSRRRLFRYI